MDLTLIQKICRTIAKFKKFDCMCITLVLMLFVFGCTNAANNDTSANVESSGNNGAYLAIVDECMYYFKPMVRENGSKIYELHRYDNTAEEDQCIDSINDWNFTGLFHIGDALCYGKSSDTRDKMELFRITKNDNEPNLIGRINGIEYLNYGELSDKDFAIFAVKNNFYVLCNEKIYKLQTNNSPIIYDGISSVFVDGDEIYYSSCKENMHGLYKYDVRTKEQSEILPEQKIREYNNTTIFGEQAYVRNIVGSNDTLYFLGAYPASGIYKYTVNIDKDITNVTDECRTKRFALYEQKLYYRNLYQEMRNKLCSTNLDNNETMPLIDNIFTYVPYKNSIYYYDMKNNDFAGLIEYNIESGIQTELMHF